MSEKYSPRIVRCLELLGDEDFWWRPNSASNAAGNIVLHLCGNVRQWIDAGLGGKKDQRRRYAEFAERRQIPRGELVLLFESTVKQACCSIMELTDDELSKTFSIQGPIVSGMTAIDRVCEHFSCHSGQIIFLTKLRLGRDRGFTHLLPYKETGI
jgi:hypothetical protein